MNLAPFDLALIDLNLPDGTGVDFIKLLRATSPETFCLVVTVFDDDKHLFPALTAGANGYLLKDLSSEEFTDEMIAKGCILGFHTEYVPVASGLDASMMLGEAERLEFRQRILRLRRTKPIIIAHLPDDEYDSEGRCEGVAGGTVHINSQGYVEPCPFCHYACDNIRDRSLEEVINSPFLA